MRLSPEGARWLVTVRWLACVAVFVTIWLTSRVLGVIVTPAPLYGVGCAMVGYNLLFWLGQRKWVPAERSVERSILLQSTLDLVALTLLLYFSDMLWNPFLFFFVFHMVVASMYLHGTAPAVGGRRRGGDHRRDGRFHLAEGGTLYLDDVDDISLGQQPKLLRAIDEKVFERVGGTTPVTADVRIIASTKRNLLEKISEGTFREDLYYRLDVLRVNIPPLRQRREDLPELAEHLLTQISRDRPCHIVPQALEVLKRHHWPGNVRELLHTLERAYLVGTGQITPELLTAEMSGIAGQKDASAEDFQAAMERTERELLENALKASSGNKTAAAAALGMKSSTFRDKLAKHELG